MQLGMVGLGRMGANMTRRLMRGGHQLVVSDLSPDSVKQLAGEGATGSSSLEDLVGKLKAAARGVDYGAGGRARPNRLCRNSRSTCRRATPSSTAATPTSKMTYGARVN